MTNVIRPTFGTKPTTSTPTARGRIENFTALRDYGSAGGHMVGLIRVDEGAGATSLCILIEPDSGGIAMTVATLPDSAEGEANAKIVASAVLRTLQFASGAFPN